jgi:superfamily II DNA or RNA helicase
MMKKMVSVGRDRMYDIKYKSGIYISKVHKNQAFYKAIIDDLTRVTQGYNDEIVINKFYKETDSYLLIPRYYPLKKVGLGNVIINREQFLVNPEQININHNITPRNELQERAIKTLLGSKACILQLAPGTGKTVISIYAISELKMKTLILVHIKGLIEQWNDRLLQFTDISEDNIARLSSKTFKEDLSKPIILSTAQTFISLLKRQRDEFLEELNNAKLGVFISDECHTTSGAPTFSDCSIFVPAVHTYGLSATPKRSDGNLDIIEYHLGKIVASDDRDGVMDARVTVIVTDYEIDTQKRYRYLYWGGKFQRARYLNLIKKSEQFQACIKLLLNKVVREDRHVICVAERIALIDQLFKELNTDNKSKFYKQEPLEKLHYKMTFATPGKIRDGIDAPFKDCLIMTSPISNIEQMTGRIVRIHPDKKTPIIIDMVDAGCKRMRSTFFTRKKYYEARGWEIQYIVCNHGKIAPVEEGLALRIISGNKEPI